jgi:hypothetical protein
MWRPLSLVLECIGRLRIALPFRVLFRRQVVVGHPSALDAQGSRHWERFATGEQLYDVWGPHPESPWVPFHCIPLFAAIDRVVMREVGPMPPAAVERVTAQVPMHARPGSPPPPWLTGDTWTMVDLPGPVSVEVAAWLVTAASCQPVCTFNNWPHLKGQLRPEHILAALLRWASMLAEVRQGFTPRSPPLWIGDSQRLALPPGRPGDFDNRYYLEDALLPGAGLLRSAGIARVVYVTVEPADAPVIDLDGYFADLVTAGLPVFIVDLRDATLTPAAWTTRPTPRTPAASGFRRSAAGGFGSVVPQPSSGGG